MRKQQSLSRARTVQPCQKIIATPDTQTQQPKHQQIKNNITYMNIFPLEKSLVYMNDINQNADNPIPTQVLIKDEELVDNVRKIIKFDNLKNLDVKEVNKYFKAVSSTPIIAKNLHNTHSNINKYQLQKQQQLNVCQNKVFRLKNYCNYLLDLQLQKSMTKIHQRNDTINEMLKQFQKQQPAPTDETNISKYLQMMNTIKNQSVILDPKHVKFEEKMLAFEPKEKERIEIMEGKKRGGGGGVFWGMPGGYDDRYGYGY